MPDCRGVACRYNALSSLGRVWYRWTGHPWEQPLARIQAYYGAAVAMYFALLAHSTAWLVLPALAGAAVYVHQAAAGRAGVPELPVYAAFVALWGSAMCDAWKRRQVTLAMEWGMTEFEEAEAARPEFNAHPHVERMASPVTGMQIFWYDVRKRRRAILVSWACMAVLVLVVVGCVFGIFVLRALLLSLEAGGELPAGYAVNIAAIVNAIQINVLNAIYSVVAVKLNDWEVHETETDYMENLVAKTFMFQAINSFFNLYYVAFVKNNVAFFGVAQPCLKNDAGAPDCLLELQTQLRGVFITRLVVGNLTEAVIPALLRLWRTRGEPRRGARGAIPPASLADQARLPAYRGLDDYLEIVIQFGFTFLFVTAYPLVALLALLSSVVELRVDAYKLLHDAARPEPRGAEDIGTWFAVLRIMCVASLVTNAAVVCFTNPDGPFGLSDTFSRVAVFVVRAHPNPNPNRPKARGARARAVVHTITLPQLGLRARCAVLHVYIGRGGS